METKQDYYISYEDLITKCKAAGFNLTWRTLNYYKSLGLLPKSERIQGDKRGYYLRQTVEVLLNYHFLQQQIGLTLTEIKDLLDKFSSKFIPKDKLHIPVAGKYFIFSQMIEATYGFFLKRTISKMSDIVGNRGVVLISALNSSYRELLLERGVDYLVNQIDLKKSIIIEELGKSIEEKIRAALPGKE